MADSSYDKVNQAFEKAVIKLQENLQYLANEGKVSDKFIAIQNLIIKALIDYQHQTESIVTDLQLDNARLMLRTSKKFQELLDIKESFEALCIIHGIVDFPQWMARGKDYLVCEAIQHNRDKTVQIPFSLMNLIDELSDSERETLFTLLHRKYEEQNRQEIQHLKQLLNAATQRD
jgi:hypothetical protein